jgi:hypothetical protein
MKKYSLNPVFGKNGTEKKSMQNDYHFSSPKFYKRDIVVVI